MRLLRFPRIVALQWAAAALAVAAAPGPLTSVHDPLPSWRPSPNRDAILSFVEQVVDEDGIHYVPPAQRIAVFDNDGTLWCEKPLYTQLAFMIDRAEAYVEDSPELADQEPYRSLLAGTLDPHADMEGFLKLAMETHTGMLDSEFTAVVESWLTLGRHARFQRPYTELVYQPMLELMAYLRDNGFEVWICTGGGQDFVRCFAREAYGVEPANVIGSSVQKRSEELDGEVVLVREPTIVKPINDRAGKVVQIERRIGRTPILAVGNSDGDLEMMRATDDGHGPALMLLVHHDDAEREYDYDKGTEQALVVAGERKWNVISIKDDFATVFPPDDEAR